MNMPTYYLDEPPLWLKITNKITKTVLLGLFISFLFVGQWPKALVEGFPTVIIEEGSSQNLENTKIKEINPLIASFVAITNAPIYTPKTIEVIVTGYSSTPEETDDTPFITASGKVVEDGVIAANFLEFGTKVRFPELFGDKVFVVEDRMHKRFSEGRVDIWFKTKQEAQNFGIKTTIMEIIEEPALTKKENPENQS